MARLALLAAIERDTPQTRKGPITAEARVEGRGEIEVEESPLLRPLTCRRGVIRGNRQPISLAPALHAHSSRCLCVKPAVLPLPLCILCALCG